MSAIVRSRAYLEQHRRMILGRSLAAALAGAIPLPLIDDWLVSAVRRSTIKRLADARGVDMDEAAIRAIADGADGPPKFAELLGGGLALRLMTRQWKKLAVAVLATRQAQAAAKSFEVATLFDHYCARVHVGMGLDDKSGALVRGRIDKARRETEGGISRHLFKRGLLAAAKTSLRAPVDIADLISGGRIAKLLSGDDEIEATSEVDEALEAQLRSETSFLARSAAAIELQLAVDRNPYLDDLVDAFDAIFREQPDEDQE